MAAWRVVDFVSFEGRLRSARGQLIIEPEDGEPTRLPVKDIAVALVGPHASFTSAAMHRLLDADVVIIFTDWRGVAEGGAYAWSKHTRVGARQIAQAHLSVPRRKNAWGRIVRAKIAGQAFNLHASNPPIAERLSGLVKEVRSGDPANIEAQAARLYWSCLFRQKFLREPQTGWGYNACLDYGYAVLRGLGIRAVVAAGLCPTLGLFHHGRSNGFNLVDDLIEPYRPAVDYVVATLEGDATPDDRETRHRLVAAAMQPFEPDGTGISASLTRLAQALGGYVEGDLDKLPVPQWSGPTKVVQHEQDPEW